MAGEGGRQRSPPAIILAEIETDKATMEFEAVDEGTIAKILIAEGTDEVKVGDGDRADRRRGRGCRRPPAPRAGAKRRRRPGAGGERRHGSLRRRPPRRAADAASASPPAARRSARKADAAIASRRARSRGGWPRQKGIDLAGLSRLRAGRADRQGGRGWRGRQGAGRGAAPAAPRLLRQRRPRRRRLWSCPTFRTRRQALQHAQDDRAPADRIEADVPHIYLTVDIRLDALLKLRGELNKGARGAGRQARGQRHDDQGARRRPDRGAGVQRLSITGDELLSFSRADISVAVSIPGGLITP